MNRKIWIKDWLTEAISQANKQKREEVFKQPFKPHLLEPDSDETSNQTNKKADLLVGWLAGFPLSFCVCCVSKKGNRQTSKQANKRNLDMFRWRKTIQQTCTHLTQSFPIFVLITKEWNKPTSKQESKLAGWLVSPHYVAIDVSARKETGKQTSKHNLGKCFAGGRPSSTQEWLVYCVFLVGLFGQSLVFNALIGGHKPLCHDMLHR